MRSPIRYIIKANHTLNGGQQPFTYIFNSRKIPLTRQMYTLQLNKRLFIDLKFDYRSTKIGLYIFLHSKYRPDKLITAYNDNALLYNRIDYFVNISNKHKLISYTQMDEKNSSFLYTYSGTITEANYKKSQYWIIKPSDASHGTGIVIKNNIDDIKTYIQEQTKKSRGEQQYIIQQYIDKPLLLYNRKFDLRVFLLYTHDHKLYIYNRFYMRLVPKIYDIHKLNEPDRHITNISAGSAVRLSDKIFNTHFNDIKLIDKLKPILKNFFDNLNNKKQIPTYNKTIKQYQMIGFDVLLDEKHKVYILEFNMSPEIFETKFNKTRYSFLTNMNDENESKALNELTLKRKINIPSQPYTSKDLLTDSHDINNIKSNLVDDTFRLTLDKVIPNKYDTKRKNDFNLIYDYGLRPTFKK